MFHFFETPPGGAAAEPGGPNREVGPSSQILGPGHYTPTLYTFLHHATMRRVAHGHEAIHPFEGTGLRGPRLPCRIAAAGRCRVTLDLELAGVVREVAEGEAPPPARAATPATLRDSHHQVARLVARGLRDQDISHLTGYALSRLSTLKHCPAFQELVAAYRYDQADVARELEAMYLGVAGDAAQIVHERLLDSSDEVSTAQALEIFKVFADRGGMAPVSRSVNKNVNLNIGARLDAARARTLKVVDHE